MQKSYKSMKKLLAKPLKALASPGIYLFGKYNQYKREREELNAASTPTENELSLLNCKINKLLSKLNGKYVEMASSPEEECVICVNAKAVMQTYPCGHKVVCRRCFVKTIQIALAQRTLPLRCVICRTKILRLRQTQNSRLQPSYSFYSRSSYNNTSKRSSNSYSGSYPLKGDPWTDGFKYSKSLPGINGGGNSQYGSFGVNRSYSSVVYRKPSNPVRRCCRSCSLGSYSWAPMHGGQSTSFKPDNIAENADTSPSQEMKDGLITRQKQSAALSRDQLIHRFQRDFHEGQVTSARSGYFKNKSSSLPSQRQAPAMELDPSSNTVENQSARNISTIVATGNCTEERTSILKIRGRLKSYKLIKFEKQEERVNTKDRKVEKKNRSNNTQITS